MKDMIKRPAGPAFWLASLAVLGCAGPQALPPSDPSSAATPASQQEEAAIASALREAQASGLNYKIGGGDLIDISVFQQPDLSRKARVTQNGEVSLPLVGTVKIGGLSVTEAGAQLAERFKEYLVSPHVTVLIQEYGNRKIVVMGEISKPGTYELPAESRLTILEAISLAGGFTQLAAPDRTRVIRSARGESQTLTIKISDITKKGLKHKDIPIEPNDVIVVPQSYF